MEDKATEGRAMIPVREHTCYRSGCHWSSFISPGDIDRIFHGAPLVVGVGTIAIIAGIILLVIAWLRASRKRAAK